MAATSDCWVYAFDILKESYTVVAPDLPGHGRSPGHAYPYSLGFYQRWLVELLDHLQMYKVTLVGSSMGGAISLTFALAYPERVERIVLVDTVGLDGKLPLSAAGWLLMRLPHFIMSTLTHLPEPYLFRYLQHWVVVDPWGIPREPLLRLDILNRSRGFWSVGAGARLLLVDFLLPHKRKNFIHRLKQVSIPTLILWGRYDGLLPVGNAFSGLSHIPGSRLQIFENSAHLPMLEEPELFNTAVNNFLRTA
jgi:pimeloyl-ACP methyl ester carboxylesterase